MVKCMFQKVIRASAQNLKPLCSVSSAMLSSSGATALKTPQNKSTPQSAMANNPITSTEPTADSHFYHFSDPIEFDEEHPLPFFARFFSALKERLFS